MGDQTQKRNNGLYKNIRNLISNVTTLVHYFPKENSCHFSQFFHNTRQVSILKEFNLRCHFAFQIQINFKLYYSTTKGLLIIESVHYVREMGFRGE